MNERTLVAVSAGLSQPSSTRLLTDRLADAAVGELRARGVMARLRTVELRELAHDIVNAMLTGFPTGELADVLDEIAQADGLVVVSPVFSASYSGLFKSFVDVLDRDSLQSMPVLLGATGGTARHSLVLEHAMRPLFTYLRATTVTTSVFAATEDWAGGAGSADGLGVRVQRAGRELAELVAGRDRTGPEDPFAGVPSLEQMLRARA